MRLKALNSSLIPIMACCISFKFYVRNWYNHNFPPQPFEEEKKKSKTETWQRIPLLTDTWWPSFKIFLEKDFIQVFLKHSNVYIRSCQCRDSTVKDKEKQDKGNKSLDHDFHMGNTHQIFFNAVKYTSILPQLISSASSWLRKSLCAICEVTAFKRTKTGVEKHV